jgi:hypothetical protein
MRFFYQNLHSKVSETAKCLRPLYPEGTRPRPFMYWANKPDEDCIERLFQYYENTTRLSRFKTNEFVEKWATKVRAIANAEK